MATFIGNINLYLSLLSGGGRTLLAPPHSARTETHQFAYELLVGGRVWWPGQLPRMTPLPVGPGLGGLSQWAEPVVDLQRATWGKGFVRVPSLG